MKVKLEFDFSQEEAASLTQLIAAFQSLAASLDRNPDLHQKQNTNGPTTHVNQPTNFHKNNSNSDNNNKPAVPIAINAAISSNSNNSTPTDNKRSALRPEEFPHVSNANKLALTQPETPLKPKNEEKPSRITNNSNGISQITNQDKLFSLLTQVGLEEFSVQDSVEIMNEIIKSDPAVDFKVLEYAFNKALCDPQTLLIRITAEKSCRPIVEVLRSMSPEFQDFFKKSFLPNALNDFRKTRAPTSDALEFYGNAETFGALVGLEMIDIKAALKVIISLLLKPANAWAGLTVLSKTVELGLEQLMQQCEPQQLNDLRRTLAEMRDPRYQYDIDYVLESFGWSRDGYINPDTTAATNFRRYGDVTSRDVVVRDVASRAQNSSSSQDSYFSATSTTGVAHRESLLIATDSMSCHNAPIHAMYYDSDRDCLLTGGQDGNVMAWSIRTRDSCAVQNTRGTNVTSLAMEPPSLGGNVLYVSFLEQGSRKFDRKVPVVAAHTYRSSMRWEFSGLLERESASLISCIDVLSAGQVAHLVSAEVFSHNQNKLCFYDVTRAFSSPYYPPLASYTDHEDLITCIDHNHRSAGSLVFSGSKDTTICVYDSRSPRLVSRIGTPGGTNQAHTMLVNDIVVVENILLSVGLDKRIMCWDLRLLSNNGTPKRLKNIPMSNALPWKIIRAPDPTKFTVCAVPSNPSPEPGIYLLNIVSEEMIRAIGFSDSRIVDRYTDIQWASNDCLYAAGESGVVDIYSFS